MNSFFHRNKIRAAGIICIMTVIFLLLPCKPRAAGEKLLTLSDAQKLAYANSRDYKKTRSKLVMKQVKYAEAVKSVALKQKNMRTFRWTPLLSFKFPSQPNLAEEYEWQYKPLQIQMEIDKLSHELADIQYEVAETVSNLYGSVYFYQEKIYFTEEQIASKREALIRNKARLRTGEANQADVEKLEKSIAKLETDLSLLLRSFETAKEKMSDLIRLDISTGYLFENSFLSADIERSLLTELTEYTLANDHSYYEIKLNTQLASISLDLNQSLMQNQYGGKMGYIQPYLNQIKNGTQVDTDAFKASYDYFLNEIDRRWQGNIKILFIKIPKEWFKGEISGIRYVEDDPYVLYSAALEYEDARTEQESAEREIKSLVSNSYEALVTAKNAYRGNKASVEAVEAELKKNLLLNRLGEVSFEELDSLQQEYEAGSLELLESLKSYSELLCTFDRLTCGGITKYLKGEPLSEAFAAAGDSFLTAERPEGAYYYIQSKIEDNLFVFGVCIPEDFPVVITDFELWVDGVQIGTRTGIGKEIRHLTLTVENTEKTEVRLYRGEQFVDQCEINASVNQASLDIIGNYQSANQETARTVAAYSYMPEEDKGIVELTIVPEEGEPIAYFQLADEKGNLLFREELFPVSERFRYLSVLANDLSRLKVLFYDVSGEFLYEGSFEERTLSIKVFPESE